MCEFITRTIDVVTPGGSMPTLLTAPATGGRHPAVVIYMDALGVREALRDIGRQIAARGYTAVLPDLYHRMGTGLNWTTEQLLNDPAAKEEIQRVTRSLPDAHVVEDTTALVAALAAEPLVADGAMGCVGFCMGGRHVFRAMAALPRTLTAGSALHPSGLMDERYGHPLAYEDTARITGDIYVGLGDADHLSPLEAMRPLRDTLREHGVRATVDVHADAEHGYMFPGPRYSERGARRSWEETYALFARVLGEKKDEGV
ncbi:dienelactone hydrolase family protein [Streptomyces sp. NBC_00459]|uniref:dienelactone hydrolase family protein n=1 Tax=Streptomyces sp. NBC_00459 TaxID=2975749 RepID=UPI002E18F2DA